MDCPTIPNLKLDAHDQEAIEEIQKVKRASGLLKMVVPSGVLATIFLGNNAAQATYNIHSAEWALFAKAMQTLPRMTRARIQQIAKLQLFRSGLSYEQRQFWKSVDRGCKES